jgi:hypothetical protein
VSRTVWAVLALLCAWALITLVRKAAEAQGAGELPDAKLRSGYQESGGQGESLEDSIDWEELERAEDEVRDIDPQAKPEDGFEGDDWGPGSARKPPVA